MDVARFNTLLDKYLTDSIAPSEEKDLLEALESAEYRDLFEQAIHERALEMSFSDAPDHAFREASYEKLENALRRQEKAPLRAVLRFAAAAIIVLVAAPGTFFIFRSHKPIGMVATKPLSPSPVPRVAPGGNKAILLLANGQTILLDSAHHGLLARQGATKVVKVGEGQLRYQGTSATGQGAVSYNTISTPRGGQYQLVLPDGTQVWLNAASSLTFPTSFTGNGRIVTMTGEAYFEVAPDAHAPFRVRVGDMTIDVLGTHFNVMAYGDESAIKTTLVQGSVKVSREAYSRILQPGEQSVMAPAGGEAPLVREADVDQAIAWKNGYFEFENMDLPTIMRQISRWYDIDIRFAGKDQDARFGGGISRKLDLTEVLHLLETNGVRFKLDNRTLLVNP